VTSVLGCWRYPVKSAAAQVVGRLPLTSDGVLGDRAWAAIAYDGTVVSAKHPRIGGRLLEVLASYDDTTGAVTVTVPGHSGRPAGDDQLDGELTEWLGRSVKLTDVVPTKLQLHRLWPHETGMIPEWIASAHPDEEVLTDVAGAARGRFVDYGQLHLVTTGELAKLEAEVGRPVHPVRFRPNLLVDLPEDPLPGQRLRVGEVSLTIDQPTSRCVIPSLPQAGVTGLDAEILTQLARHHRKALGQRGKAALFGCYANVVRAGAVNRGDEVRLAAD